MEISLVVAMSRNRVIGRQGGLPWRRLAADMAHFTALTTGHPVVMGRKTYESIPSNHRPLKDRTNIVVTRDPTYAEASIHCASLEEALGRAKEAPGAERVCVIGGGQIYAEALPLADTVYLTRVNAALEGDTHFPELGEEWELISSTPFPQNEHNDHDGTFETYRRTGC